MELWFEEKVSDHEKVMATGLFDFALINFTELSPEDWNEIRHCLRAVLPKGKYDNDHCQDQASQQPLP